MHFPVIFRGFQNAFVLFRLDFKLMLCLSKRLHFFYVLMGKEKNPETYKVNDKYSKHQGKIEKQGQGVKNVHIIDGNQAEQKDHVCGYEEYLSRGQHGFQKTAGYSEKGCQQRETYTADNTHFPGREPQMVFERIKTQKSKGRQLQKTAEKHAEKIIVPPFLPDQTKNSGTGFLRCSGYFLIIEFPVHSVKEYGRKKKNL